MADAGVLGVPHRLDGPRADHVHLPGPLHALPGTPRAKAQVQREGLGLHRGRRDRRARDPGGAARRRARTARQPDLGGELQPAAPRRPGLRERTGRAGARAHLPRRGLERDQGRVGTPLGRAVGPGHRGPALEALRRDGGRLVAEVRRGGAQVLPRALLRRGPQARRARSRPLRRGPRGPLARPGRARPHQGVRRVPRGRGAPGPAHRDPRAHDQGVRPRGRGRGAQRRAPGEEARYERFARVP